MVGEPRTDNFEAVVGTSGFTVDKHVQLLIIATSKLSASGLHNMFYPFEALHVTRPPHVTA